jgi:actin-related protein
MKKSYKTYVNKNPKTDMDLLIDVFAPPRRNINVFMGGAMFCDILDGMEGWIPKKLYEEHGFARVDQMIFNKLKL